MGLFDIFKRKKVDSNLSGSTLFYHEDDFCQIELSPIENLSLFQAQSDEINDLASKEAGTTGFTEIYVRDDNDRLKLSERKITPAELEEIIHESGLEKAETVTTGYGQTFREISKNTIGFGKNYSAIYFDFDNGIVQHIWLTGLFSIDKEALTNTLHKVGLKWNLLLMDWNQTRSIDLLNIVDIDGYLTR
jgi:hypothetical protein